MKKLKFRLQLVVTENEEESAEEVVELAVLEKDCKTLEHLGLSLAESKDDTEDAAAACSRTLDGNVHRGQTPLPRVRQAARTQRTPQDHVPYAVRRYRPRQPAPETLPLLTRRYIHL